MEPCVSQNQKGIFAFWVWLERKSWKGAEAKEKNIPELKPEFACVCVREKKISFKIHLITLIDIRNVNLLFKKDFKFAELLTKPSFFAYFRDIPENGEWNKVDVESICAKVTKHVSKKVAKADANLNWLWTIKFIMDCFDCIFIFTNDLA